MKGEKPLRDLVAAFSAPARKRGIMSRGAARVASRLDAARSLALAASVHPPDPAVTEALSHAVAEFPDERALRPIFAAALANDGRSADAIAEFEEHLRAVPDDGTALFGVAAIYEGIGRADLALERYQRAVDARVTGGDLDGAVEAARRLIALEPASLERASELLALMRSRDPASLAGALEHLADVYRSREKLGQEAKACAELLSIAPERQDVRDRLRTLYVRIVTIDPGDDDTWAALERIDPDRARTLRGEFGVTIPAAGSAPVREEPHGAYARRKSRELLEAGDVLGASLCLERAIRTLAEPRAHLELAQCYAALHREADAGQTALRGLAVALYGGEDEAADALVGWLIARRPDVEGKLCDVVFLNRRPVTADIVYEELLLCWDEASGPPDQAAAGR